MDKFWERYITSRPAPGESKGAFDAFAAASRAQEPRTMAQAPIAEDLEPGSLRDEMLKGFDPSQETHEEYLQRINLERPFNAAHGGRIGFADGKNVKPGRVPGKDYGDKYRWKRKNWDTYQSILDDYSSSVDGVIKEGNVTKIKSLREFFNEGKYKNEKGDLINRSTFESWVKNNNKRPVATKDIFKAIYNNTVTKANAGEKWISIGDFARSMGLTGEGRIASGQLQEWTKSHKTGLKELDSIETKVTRNANKLFSNLDQPVENFFSPMKKIGEMTGTSGQVAGKILKNYNFPADKEIIRSLGTPTVQGKISGMNWRLDDFIDYYNNKSFMDPSTLKQLANVDTTAGNIVQDAWRHTLDGGKDIEWIERPKLNKDGQVTSWLDAKFRYVGEGIDTPLNQRKIWTVGNQNPDKNIFNIEFVGREAPEFKRQFEITQEMFNFNNELVKHPVKGTMVKRGQLMKEMYHYGTGTGFAKSAYERDHFNIKDDVFGIKSKNGLRIIPRRINQAAGQIKVWKRYTEKGLGSPITKLKYAEKAGADKYEKIGYNFNKTPAELAKSEYEFAKKFFNKFQAAGWNWDGKNWKIKPGMEESANAVLTNKGRIIRSPIDIATDYKKIGQTILNEQDWWKLPPKQQTDIFKMAGFEYQPLKMEGIDLSKPEGRLKFRQIGTAKVLNKILEKNNIKICNDKLQGGKGVVCGATFAERDPKAFLEAIKRNKDAAFIINKPGLVKGALKGLSTWAKGELGPFGWIGSLATIDAAFGVYELGQGATPLQALDTTLWFLPKSWLKADEKTFKGVYERAGFTDEDFGEFKKWMKLEDLDQQYFMSSKQLKFMQGQVFGKQSEADKAYQKEVDALPDAYKDMGWNRPLFTITSEEQKTMEHPFYGPAVDRHNRILAESHDVYESLKDPDKSLKDLDYSRKLAAMERANRKKQMHLATLEGQLGYGESMEEILDRSGNLDLLYPEYVHPIEGPSVSAEQMRAAGFAGGGMVGIRKPNAIAPTGGPMSQGLRSLYINDKDY